MQSNENSKSNPFDLDLDSLLKDIKKKTPASNHKLEEFFKAEKKPSQTTNPNIPPKNEKVSAPKVNEKQEKQLETTNTSIEEYKASLHLSNFQPRIQPGCKFCDIIQNQKNKLIYEDENGLCVAFLDKAKIGAQEHILMCPTTHIKNSHCIDKNNIPLLLYMEEAGKALLKKRRPNAEYRFGYHEPPKNTIDHLHLHCIVLPITNPYLNGVVFGKFLTKTETIIAKILSGEITPGVYPEKVKKTKEKTPKNHKLDDYITLDDK